LDCGTALGYCDCTPLNALGLKKDSFKAPEITSMVDFFFATPSSIEEDACVIPPSIEAAGLTTRLWVYAAFPVAQHSTLSGYLGILGTSQTIEIDWTGECTSYCPTFLVTLSLLNQIWEA